jgi:hypothetical protein
VGPNSDDAKVGDWMMAAGNPFGLGSVTAGIISAVGRDINEGSLRRFPANRRTDQPRQFRLGSPAAKASIEQGDCNHPPQVAAK